MSASDNRSKAQFLALANPSHTKTTIKTATNSNINNSIPNSTNNHTTPHSNNTDLSKARNQTLLRLESGQEPTLILRSIS